MLMAEDADPLLPRALTPVPLHQPEGMTTQVRLAAK